MISFKKNVQKIDYKVRSYRARLVYSEIEKYLQPKESLLDIGAGDCLIAKMIKEKKKMDVTVIDIINSNITDLNLILYDGYHFPFKDKQFDLALLSYVLHHSSDAKEVLKEARRICKKTVIVIEDLYSGKYEKILNSLLHWYLEKFVCMSKPTNLHPPGEWLSMFTETGLDVKNVISLGRDDCLFPVKHIIFILSPIN